MPIPLIPIAVVTLAGGAWYKARKRKMMTPERKVIYETALNTMTDPNQLRALAAEFEKQGLKAEGEMLRKRAALKELPEDVKQGRKEAYQAGLKSDDPVKVEGLAAKFAETGSTGAAASLRSYAAGLKAANPALNQPKSAADKVRDALGMNKS